MLIIIFFYLSKCLFDKSGGSVPVRVFRNFSISTNSTHCATIVFTFLTKVLNTLAGDALDNEDFAPVCNVSVTINSHQTKTIYTSIVDDVKFEQDEDFYVEITGADVGDGINVVNILISDDDRKLASL